MELVVYLILMSTAAAMAVLRPAWAAGAALCMFGLDQLGQISSPLLVARQTFSNYAIGLMVLVGVFKATRITRANVLKLERGQVAILLLMLYAVASVMWTPVPDAAWTQIAANAPFLIVLVALAPLTISTTDDLLQAMWSVVILGGILSVTLLSFGNWGSRGLVVSSVAIAETNPLALAMVGGVVTLAAFSLQPSIGRTIPALVALTAAVAGILLIFRSGARGELFGVGLSILMAVWLRTNLANHLRQRIFNATVVLTVLGLAAYYGATMFVQAEDVRWTSETMATDATERMQMASRLLTVWSSDFASIFFGLGNAAAFDPRIVGFYPHNMPLEVLCEEGILGFGVLLFMVVYAAKSFFTLHRRHRGTRGHGAIVFAGVLVTFTLLLSLKEGSLFGSAYILFGCVVLFRLRALTARKGRPVRRTTNFANAMP